MWRSAREVSSGHDFARYPLGANESAELHRRVDVDYNAWWCCLIPRRVVEDLGLPLPLFIKWDDAEYGLRAAQCGYPTVTLPGAAIWHLPWSEKDPTDWQAYFHQRNRLIVAAMYSQEKHPAGVFAGTARTVLRHLLACQYSTACLQQMAIEDFLAGPGTLFELLPDAIGKARRARACFDDGRAVESIQDLPLPSMRQVRVQRLLRAPETRGRLARAILVGLLHNLRPVKAKHHRRPQANLGSTEAAWYVLARLDGATVTGADGAMVTYRKRDPAVFRQLLGRAVRNQFQLMRRFRRLRKRYRRAHPGLTSPATWAEVFERGA
jgi:galactofuranosylgalactofuranosylrhamnosyl-N-acetylglucosaminyl-diphospho-decaprenol beta-1,5/1,6-galactofuranosyltransferase